MKRIFTTLIVLIFVFSAGFSQQPQNGSEIPDSVRMAWWQEAKFGMFIHWGIYSVPAGFYKGEAQTNSAEWIMNKGKIPIAEYEKFADGFNPESFDPKTFVGLAKEAGMKYMVITAKHHDGFSMFNSKSNPYNVVQATPFKRDILKELADECQAQGLRFGFYYSQAQDWHHPGGMGNNWDTTFQRVSTDEYLEQKAIPEVEQLLTEYGPIAIFWWDTPRQMTKEVVDKLYHVTTDLQPEIITNDRLGEDYPGDHKTFERNIPRIAPDEKYWEVCMPISGSWGYRSDDKNFKSERTLIHNLVDITSKGGNYLLNVSPTAQGTLMPEAVERLHTMGKWMEKNSESIYGTEASPCAEPEWGRVTMKSKDGKATLYLNVFDWSADKTISVRLKNKVKSCFLLTDPTRVFATNVDSDGINIKLIGAASNPFSSVVVLELYDMPNALPLQKLGADDNGIINLPGYRAQFRNLDGPGAEYNLRNDYVTQWDSDKASVYWTFQVDTPGEFSIVASVASEKEATLTYTVEKKYTTVTIPPNGNFRRFKDATFGTFKFSKSGTYTIILKPVEGKWNEVNLREVRLIPKVNEIPSEDWPNLKKYQLANSKLALPKSKENRVVFMGNSITEFWERADSTFFKVNPYLNRGIAGQTTAQMVLRFRQDVIDLKPKVVVIHAGTNDIAGNRGPATLEQIAGNIFSMAELAKSNGIKVVLASVLPATSYSWRPGIEPADQIIELNNRVMAYAKKNKMIYLDYYSPMVNDSKGLKKEYGRDTVHPNLPGYHVMEPLVKTAIEKALKLK